MATFQPLTSDNFLEIKDVDVANKVDLKVYSFIRFSESRNAYIFKKRQRVVKE
ncbi:MAG: hypothetical protein ACYTEU_05800 [Planctomycetota bacterium]|jgi:hypothetical protein